MGETRTTSRTTALCRHCGRFAKTGKLCHFCMYYRRRWGRLPVGDEINIYCDVHDRVPAVRVKPITQHAADGVRIVSALHLCAECNELEVKYNESRTV